MSIVTRALERHYNTWKLSPLSRKIKRRRYERVMSLLLAEGDARRGLTALDVGCAHGSDFIQFALSDGVEVVGVDHDDQYAASGFELVRGDATQLPFRDGCFDLAVSMGVFEHIAPMDKLIQAAAEISRVARRFCVVVPSTGTLIEPHTMSPLWQMRAPGRKRVLPSYPVNYLSDEAWLQLPAFRGAKTARMWYLPGLNNLLIYGSGSGRLPVQSGGP
jgi:ubiquinone/menaquinone biosynthesis C-methylase UbiE